MKPAFEKLFGFDSSKHSVRTEILAGLTTFLTMAYILAVNPGIFSALDMPGGAVFTATALAAIVGTLVMALFAKKPFGLAPGMGLNAFFVFTVCLGMGHSWQFALTAVFLEGLIFIILTITKVRSWLLNAIPGTLKKAIGAGIGLFIAFIGLQNAGIIVNNDATLVGLGNITSGPALLGIIGLFITAGLVMAKVRGGMLLGILATSVIGLFMKDPATGEAITKFSGVVSLPASIEPIFCKFEWSSILSWDMLAVVFTFLFIDMFDTMGTIIGVHQSAGIINKGNEEIPGLEKMFLADSIATVAGACFGTSTTTTYVESASGVGEGGRTGLTAFSTALFFILALFFSPIFLAIPSAATAPALIIVGVLMMPSVKTIHWDDYSKAIPAFVTIIM
ncbi:MAG: NCS2 family permease, partial [Bacteroidales bacterium]|nr:NCS2 family permease [Bacteroidales bacterium]